jgi:peptidoglycan/LPS O-acetylase OafA/YrhL
MANIRKYEPTLDGIRGVAILLVLLSHRVWVFRATPLTHWFLPAMTFGWCGVDLFFVLSGYLITGILIRTKKARNRATSFYARRFLRIFPIYYLALIGILMIAPHSGWLRSVLPYNTTRGRIAYFAYLQNFLPMLWRPSAANILGHFWSLAVEEQFYIIWPFIVWNISPKNLIRLCVIGTAGALVFSSAIVWRFGPHLWMDILPVTRGAGLLVGSGLAALLSTRGHIPRHLLFSMAAIGASVIAFIAFADPAEFTNTDAGPYMYTIGISGLALLSGALVASSNYSVPFFTAALNAPWLKSFGKYSYGIYVYHLPLFFFLDYSLPTLFGFVAPLRTAYALPYVAVTIGICFALAWLSYNLFESRLLALKSHFDPIYSQPEVRLKAAADVAD